MAVLRIPTTNDYSSSGELVAQRGDEEGSGFGLPHGAVKLAVLDKRDAALSADEAFVLVDLSDTTNFPHTETGKVRLYRIELDMEMDTAGDFDIYIGVIVEVDATNGTAEWIDVFRFRVDEAPADNTSHYHLVREYYGLDLEVDGSNDTLYNVVTNSEQAGSTNWQTDVSLDSPVGDTSSAPGDGDLVMFVDQTAGNLYIAVKVFYRTEE